MLVSIANPTLSILFLRSVVISSKKSITFLLKNNALFFSTIISNFVASILLEPSIIVLYS